MTRKCRATAVASPPPRSPSTSQRTGTRGGAEKKARLGPAVALWGSVCRMFNLWIPPKGGFQETFRCFLVVHDSWSFWNGPLPCFLHRNPLLRNRWKVLAGVLRFNGLLTGTCSSLTLGPRNRCQTPVVKKKQQGQVDP